MASLDAPGGAAAPRAGCAPKPFVRTAALFRSLLSHSEDIFAVFGHDGRVLYMSPSVERMLGFTPEELVGAHNHHDLATHAHRKPWRAALTLSGAARYARARNFRDRALAGRDHSCGGRGARGVLYVAAPRGRLAADSLPAQDGGGEVHRGGDGGQL